MAEQHRSLPVIALLAFLATLIAVRQIGSADPGIALLGWIATVLGLTAVAAAGWAMAGGLDAPEARSAARVGWVAALVHLFVVVAHSAAHDELGVGLSAVQLAYAMTVIVAAPLVAAVLLLGRWARFGAGLLAAAMAGALVFGLYWHYVAISPDHVAHLPPGDAQGLFRVTAALLIAVEALGVVSGLWGLARLRGTARVG